MNLLKPLLILTLSAVGAFAEYRCDWVQELECIGGRIVPVERFVCVIDPLPLPPCFPTPTFPPFPTNPKDEMPLPLPFPEPGSCTLMPILY